MKLPIFIKTAIAVSAGLMLAVSVCFAQSDGSGIPFKDGESFSYVLHYKWGVINANIAQISTTLRAVDFNGEKCFHYYCSGTTFKVWDSFFKVRDIFEAKFTADDVSPRYFHRDVNEGNYRATNVFSYDDVSKKVKIHVTKNSDYRLDSTLYLGGGQIYDILSMLGHLRAVDMKNIIAGHPVTLTMAMDRNMMDVSFRFIQRETVKVDGLGKFKAVKVGASVIPHKDHFKGENSNSQFDVASNANQVFKGKDDIIIWVSDDDNMVPLLFRSPVSVGSVNGTLTRMSNQKYPVTSRVSD
jgi:hypothetical protein